MEMGFVVYLLSLTDHRHFIYWVIIDIEKPPINSLLLYS